MSVCFKISVTILFMCFVVITASAEVVTLKGHAEYAREYMENQDWNYASYEWRQAIEENPRDPGVHEGLARSLMNGGYPDEAAAHLQSVVRKLHNTGLYVLLARAYEQCGDPEHAAIIYRELLSGNAFSPEAYEGLRRVSERLAPTQRAKNLDYLNQLGRSARRKADAAYGKNLYRQAAVYYEVAAMAFPDRQVINNYGVSLLLSGQPNQALQQFDRIRKQNNYWQVEANYGLAMLSLGKTYSARKSIERAISLTGNMPQRARLYNMLGYTYETSVKFSRAKYAYQRAVQLDPTFMKARRNLAYAYQRTGDYEQAIDTYKGILSRQPNDPETMNMIAFTYELWQKPRSAKSYYKKAIRYNPSHKLSYYNLGMLYKKMNKTRKSEAYFRKLTELEFDELENKRLVKNQGGKISPLFQYIDVFLAENAG